jgi:uncharacterized protein (DUF2236 family)
VRTIATTATREAVLPPREEAAELIPPRDGVVWRVAGDARIFGASGYALLLQVTHPSVGAGVSEHSDFKADPWGRLLRTLDYTSSVIYGGPDLAWDVGRRVREMHKSIKGVRPDGERYHALDPHPYAWVHATLADAIVRAHNLFCRPALTPAETDRFWAEWRRMGRLIGVRDGDLPETWPELLAYFDEMVDEELQDTEAAQDVLVSLLEPKAPPLPGLRRDWVWRVVSWPSTRAGSLATLGMLPPVLRRRLRVEWTAGHQRRFDRMAAVTRRARPLMPSAARNFGPHYLRWRHKAIERGDVASPSRSGARADRAAAAA